MRDGIGAPQHKETHPQVGWLAEVDSAFSGTGIKSFVLEGALGELQVRRQLPWPRADVKGAPTSAIRVATKREVCHEADRILPQPC